MPVNKEQTMTQKSIPQFAAGEKAYSRYGDPVTVLEWPVYYGRPGDPPMRGGRYIHPGPGPLALVQTANKNRCYWPPEWIVKPGGQIPLMIGEAA